ncbi:1-acyl-sn-glycerol-3-phosphate acyltransferase [Alcanivorax sp. DG881]|jgi:1-acyl-sn-glycerol-3-phosphate acyltransferase|uniref:lysophospholipid acyltransferase family protein n=1 Tax=Alcanivorax sp. DG881 TaxID=236097 RepID=UPI00017EDA2D|nr:lysophospholipid acyltransferase family protein [Alcanivorax sp. DG881]EDX89653.1 Acyltransferase domain protein [Alcanivorax sp. DG881]
MSEMNHSASVCAYSQGGLWPQLRRVGRVIRVVLYLLRGFVLAFLLGAFWSPYRPVVLAAKQRWCRHFLRILGVELTVTGSRVEAPVFLVSNHVSWLDIPVIASQRHLYFLSKAEVGDWPLIGTLARAMGTLFIKRGSGESVRKAQEIAGRLQQGHTVLVFPEGTTTDGSSLRRFFPQLFDAPLLAGVPVQPLAVRYLDNMGAPDRGLAFIGDDEFHHHLWAMLLRQKIRVRLHFCTPLDGEGMDRKQLCAQAYERLEGQLKVQS